MTIAKTKLSDNVSNGFFFLFFLTFVTLFSTVKLSTYLPILRFYTGRGDDEDGTLHVRAPSSITELGRYSVSL